MLKLLKDTGRNAASDTAGFGAHVEPFIQPGAPTANAMTPGVIVVVRKSILLDWPKALPAPPPYGVTSTFEVHTSSSTFEANVKTLNETEFMVHLRSLLRNTNTAEDTRMIVMCEPPTDRPTQELDDFWFNCRGTAREGLSLEDTSEWAALSDQTPDLQRQCMEAVGAFGNRPIFLVVLGKVLQKDTFLRVLMSGLETSKIKMMGRQQHSLLRVVVVDPFDDESAPATRTFKKNIDWALGRTSVLKPRTGPYLKNEIEVIRRGGDPWTFFNDENSPTYHATQYKQFEVTLPKLPNRIKELKDIQNYTQADDVTQNAVRYLYSEYLKKRAVKAAKAKAARAAKAKAAKAAKASSPASASSSSSGKGWGKKRKASVLMTKHRKDEPVRKGKQWLDFHKKNDKQAYENTRILSFQLTTADCGCKGPAGYLCKKHRGKSDRKGGKFTGEFPMAKSIIKMFKAATKKDLKAKQIRLAKRIKQQKKKRADKQRESRLEKARQQQKEGEASLEEWLKLQKVKVVEEVGKTIYNRKKDLHANYVTWCNGFNPKKKPLSLAPKSKEKVGRGFTNVLLRLMQKQVGKNARQKNLIKECVNPADSNGPTYIPHLVLK